MRINKYANVESTQDTISLGYYRSKNTIVSGLIVKVLYVSHFVCNLIS